MANECVSEPDQQQEGFPGGVPMPCEPEAATAPDGGVPQSGAPAVSPAAPAETPHAVGHEDGHHGGPGHAAEVGASSGVTASEGAAVTAENGVHEAKKTVQSLERVNQAAEQLGVKSDLDTIRAEKAEAKLKAAEKTAHPVTSAKGAAAIGGTAGVASVGLDTVVDLARGKHVDGKQVATNAAVAAGTGTAAGVATQQLARVAGKAAGPLVDGAVAGTYSGINNYKAYASGKQSAGESIGKTAIDVGTSVGAGIVGAKTGAALGTFIGGPVGTVVGAGAGFLVGWGANKLLGAGAGKLKNWLWGKKDDEKKEEKAS